MPRPARSKNEVRRVKNNILEKALSILIDQGYDNLSMSKIGKNMGMTAANIYNYYQNKDELYNSLIIEGYNRLHDTLEKNTRVYRDPFDRVMALARAYLDFGMANPHYYHLMFSLIAPKYRDYVGTPLEDIARKEKQISLGVIDFAALIVGEYTKDHPGYAGVDNQVVTIQLWSQLHGIISLHNSGNLIEAVENTEQIIEGIVSNIEIMIKKGIK